MEIIKNLLLNGAEGRAIGFDLHYERTGIKKPLIIYVHGFNGFKDWGNFDLIANHFASNGFFFIKMNLSHNGTSPENPADFVDTDAYSRNNYSKELFDLGCMTDWVCDGSNVYKGELDANAVILLGHSRGGGISILKAYHDDRIKGLITWAAVPECKTPWGNWDNEKMAAWKKQGVVYIANKRTWQQMPLSYQLFEDYEQNKENLDIRTAIQNLDIPVQICHGTQDEAVPYTALLQFRKWKSDADFVTVDSNHVFGRRHPYNENFIPEACLSVIEQNIAFLQNNGFRI